MKLCRYGAAGEEKPGLIDEDGRIRSLEGVVSDIGGPFLDPAKLAALSSLNPHFLPVVKGDVRLGVPIVGVGKIIGIGLNYKDHAKEANLKLPPEPIWFLKATSALSGPNDTVIIPPGARMVDWEVELAVVIGRKAAQVSVKDALSYVAGYTIINDVSERDYQLNRGPQWTKGKSCDTFAPLGPWLVTVDEIGDPNGLDIWLEVNGTRHQQSNTGHMQFSVADLVSVASSYMSLQPGDVIATGTPSGVGYALTPQKFLQGGDMMTLGISGLGQQQTIVALS